VSGANYEFCLICDSKAVYVGEDEWPEGVAVIHVKCHQEAIATAVADERERIAKLADDHAAAYTRTSDTEATWHLFADLIRRQP
jgi:hypothetical protein